MQLTSARVQLFQNIVDSTTVDIERDTTCLVGKNESGKTAFLEALRRLNPAPEPKDFDPLEHYPRWRYTRDRAAGEVDESIPVQATFELDDGEVASIEDEYGEDALSSRTLTVRVTYSNDRHIEADVNRLEVLKHVAFQLPQGHQLRNAVTRARTVESFRDSWFEARDDWNAEQDGPTESVQRIDALLRADSIGSEVGRIVEDSLPRFFYFSDQSLLPGRFPLGELLEKHRQGEPLSDAEATALSLLSLVGGREENLTAEDFEQRVAELEAAANFVTEDVLNYWSQNDQIRVDFQVDPTEEQDNQGNRQIVERYLEVRLRDQRHQFTTNFDLRSSGFRWFFSFLVAFKVFEQDDNAIVLLDEPGLNLHAKAQGDYLRFIDNELSDRHQVIYTTHSPFMIDPSGLGRVRLVEEKDEEPDEEVVGTKITKDALSTDRDTIFPLQGALGYEISQTLFVGPANLVVEGISDYVYLEVLSNHLEDLDREHLDFTEITISPVGSVSKVPTFVKLLGTHLDVTVLVDSEHDLNQRLTDLVTKDILEAQRLITIGDITGEREADIEDMFEPGEYLDLYNQAFGRNIDVGDLSGRGPIVDQIDEYRADFVHWEPAEVLLRQDPGPFLNGLSDATLDRFEQLFERVNATLD